MSKMSKRKHMKNEGLVYNIKSIVTTTWPRVVSQKIEGQAETEVLRVGVAHLFLRYKILPSTRRIRART